MNNNLRKGKIKRWNDDKGFGFIASENGKRDIFIHISALKRMGRRPLVGDVVTYQIHTDYEGKQRAVNVKIEGVTEVTPSPRRKHVKKQENNSLVSNAFMAVLVVAIGSIAYIELIKTNGTHEHSATSISNSAIKAQNTERYSCAGKVYCSEMTSCSEAKFYQRNCPGTKMDGDGDGIPCESQWCSW